MTFLKKNSEPCKIENLFYLKFSICNFEVYWHQQKCIDDNSHFLSDLLIVYGTFTDIQCIIFIHMCILLDSHFTHTTESVQIYSLCQMFYFYFEAMINCIFWFDHVDRFSFEYYIIVICCCPLCYGSYKLSFTETNFQSYHSLKQTSISSYLFTVHYIWSFFIFDIPKLSGFY